MSNVGLSGGDYSPISHTFFKRPGDYPNETEDTSNTVIAKAAPKGKQRGNGILLTQQPQRENQNNQTSSIWSRRDRRWNYFTYIISNYL